MSYFLSYEEIMNYKYETYEEMFDRVEQEFAPLLSRSTLDKYIHNPFLKQRFINDSAIGQKDLSSEPGIPGFKKISELEYEYGIFSYFDKNREKMEKDFKNSFYKEIGPEKYTSFVDTIAKTWTAGNKGRKDPLVQSLMQAIYNFLSSRNNEPNNFILKNFTSGIHEPMFSNDEVKKLLLINSSLLEYYLTEYCYQVSKPNETTSLTTDSLWVHRGLFINEEWEAGKKYYEKDLLNSYALSISISEKFSKIKKNKVPSIVGWNVHDIINQVIAFYAFIPGMTNVQTELIVIPRMQFALIKNAALTSHIKDYELMYK